MVPHVKKMNRTVKRHVVSMTAQMPAGTGLSHAFRFPCRAHIQEDREPPLCQVWPSADTKTLMFIYFIFPRSAGGCCSLSVSVQSTVFSPARGQLYFRGLSSCGMGAVNVSGLYSSGGKPLRGSADRPAGVWKGMPPYVRTFCPAERDGSSCGVLRISGSSPVGSGLTLL